MKKDQKLELLQKWIKRLGLYDWNISIMLECKPHELTEDCRIGEVEYNEVNKIAIIRVIDEKYYFVENIPYDFEKTIIHELLHLKFALLDESGNKLQDRMLHQIIDDLARAFKG